MTTTLDTPPSTERTDPVPHLDLARPDLHHTLDLQGVFADLRHAHPVSWHGPKSRPGFWSVTRHADVVRVYRDTATFTATHGMTIDSVGPDPDPATGMMAEVTDPPEHRRLRRGIGGFFTDGAVAAMEPDVRALVRRLLTGIRDRDEPVDFVPEAAARIPTQVAGLLLGLPPEDLDWIAERTAQVFLSGEAVQDGRRADLDAQATRANGELLSYFSKLVRSGRRQAGRRGLVQQLSEGTASRDGLTKGEVILNALNMAIAGTQTTRNSLGNMLLAFVQCPQSFRDLCADPELVPSAVEESVRWANPVRHITRVATRDVDLGGRAVRAGDPVVLWQISANRDETVFALPHVFDIRRHPNPHIGFATGAHSCPGSGLARLQMRTTLTCLTELFTGVELAGTPELVRSNFLHGYEHLPVRFTARHKEAS
ncbi:MULTISPECIES: cytochrome P450 [unclassified Streptomyces]|uniref:cytochrome P450 n=1 Tax=unclassified Streptomyces TaxID=2593676 RepID=UPI0034203407